MGSAHPDSAAVYADVAAELGHGYLLRDAIIVRHAKHLLRRGKRTCTAISIYANLTEVRIRARWEGDGSPIKRDPASPSICQAQDEPTRLSPDGGPAAAGRNRPAWSESAGTGAPPDAPGIHVPGLSWLRAYSFTPRWLPRLTEPARGNRRCHNRRHGCGGPAPVAPWRMIPAFLFPSADMVVLIITHVGNLGFGPGADQSLRRRRAYHPVLLSPQTLGYMPPAARPWEISGRCTQGA